MKRLLAVILAIGIMSGLFVPYAFAEETKASSISANPKGAVKVQLQPENRISKEVKEAFAKDEYVRYIVLLTDKADVFGAADVAAKAARNKGMVGKDLKAVKGAAVVRALTETAQRSQGDLIKTIQRLQTTGAVKAYRPFWITNAIAVTSTQEAMEALAKIPQVKSIILDVKRQYIPPTERPSGGIEAETTASLDRKAQIQSIEWNIERVEAPAVWAMGYKGQGTVVANLDTGVQGDHPALARKWRGLDPDTGEPGELAIFSWFDPVNGRNSFPYDDHGHGTHTMGTICGSDPEGLNQIGVAPDAQWIAVKILDSEGNGSDSDIIAGGQWLSAPTDAQGNPHPEYAPDVVNNSWGAGPVEDEWFIDVVNSWRAAGIFPAFSAGNDGPGPGTIGNPGNYPVSFAVGATDNNNNLASFSSRGPSPYGEVKPEISAPGVGIRSSIPGGYEGGWNGTSMACPHVAGTVALMRSIDPDLTVDELETLLTQSATPLTSAEYPDIPNNGFGWGLVNAYSAMLELVGAGTVSGKVLRSGDDLEPPTLQHEPVTEAFVGFDLPITVRAQDNVSIVSVELLARVEGQEAFNYIEMQRISGDHKDGVYEGVLPWYLFRNESTQVEYFIRVRDYGGNIARSPEDETQYHTIRVKVGVEPGYSEDFEEVAYPTGWAHGGDYDCWEWGVPTSGPMGAHSGEKLFATNLSGNYTMNANCYLLMPPLDLRNVSTAFLRFWHWYDLEVGYDFGVIFASLDGRNWTYLSEFNGQSGGWKKQKIDLTPFAGQVVYLLFNLFSDNSVAKPGWYIDDVALIGPDAQAPSAPEGLTAQDSGLGSVQLAWLENPEEDIKEYSVYRRVYDAVYGPADFAKIASTPQTIFIDSNPIFNQINQYVVTAVDLGGNESAPSNMAQAIPVGPTTLLDDNFESSAPGWTHGGTGDCWELGTPTSGPGGAHSGTNLWATNLDGPYPSSMDAWLVSPSILLPSDAGSYAISFWHWYEMETTYDKGFVEISKDGGTTWTQLGVFSHSSNGKLWAQEAYNLTVADYGGETINLRFRLKSDASIQKAGWYIDDVKVLALPNTENSLSVSYEAQEERKSDLPSPEEPTLPKDKPNLEVGPDFKWEDVQTGKPEDAIIVQDNAPPVEIQSLPLDAVVTVKETGRSVRTDPATGNYSLAHAPGSYTLRVYSYGYYVDEKPVTITGNQNTRVNFILEPIPRSQVTGVVTDRNTGLPIAGAVLSLVEDPYVAPVVTNQNGQYVIDCYIGEYTLHISAPTYYPQNVSITVDEGIPTVADVVLRPFIGYPGELAYDDRTAENAYGFYDAGNGWAVRMTPEGGAAMLKTVSFRFWDTTWPSPGGTAFKWAVFDATGVEGSPGNMVAGPFDGVALRDGNWTIIDCQDLGITVTGEFYVACIQAVPYPNCPGLAVDEDGQQYGRSWQFVGGQWSPRPEDEGNTMIRASVLYPVGIPTITSPTNETVTNQQQITVEGLTSPNVEVRLYRGEEEVGRATSDGQGRFGIPVTLADGPNVLIAKAWVNDRFTDPSLPVTVHLDTVAPTLSVEEPIDGYLTNKDSVTVRGTVFDTYLKEVKVNNILAPVADGHFAVRILLTEQDGQNIIETRAFDRAGNVTTISKTVTKDTQPPSITDMIPSANVELVAGETVPVSFKSEPGLFLAAFQIVVSTRPQAQALIPMTEDPNAPGTYQGSWVVPQGVYVKDAEVQFRAQDAAGNTAEATAPGRLNGPHTAALTIMTESFVNGTKGTVYTATLQATGGLTPYKWRIATGMLPPGLALNEETGAISGTPTEVGASQFTVEVTDKLQSKAQKALSIEIRAPQPPPPPPPPPAPPSGGGIPPAPPTGLRETVLPGINSVIGGGNLGLTLTIPQGILSQPTQFGINRKTHLPGADGLIVPGSGFEVTATTLSGATLGIVPGPVEMLSNYTQPLAKGTYFARYIPEFGRWMALPTTVNESDGTVHASTRYVSGVFALVTFPDMVDLTDIRGHWAEEYILGLSSLGIVGGYPGGLFMPDANITRAEFIKLVVMAKGLAPKHGSNLVFEDMKGHWAAPFVEAAFEAGWVTGSDGKMRPDDPITRAEMATILGRALGLASSSSSTSFADNSEIPQWARGYVDALCGMNIISGRPGNLFDPNAYGTRAESAKMVWSILK